MISSRLGIGKGIPFFPKRQRAAALQNLAEIPMLIDSHKRQSSLARHSAVFCATAAGTFGKTHHLRQMLKTILDKRPSILKYFK
jgi:hypothetical protein